MHSVLLDADGRTNAEASASHCETQKKKKEEKREKKKKTNNHTFSSGKPAHLFDCWYAVL
jgi:hypothetical protein